MPRDQEKKSKGQSLSKRVTYQGNIENGRGGGLWGNSRKQQLELMATKIQKKK